MRFKRLASFVIVLSLLVLAIGCSSSSTKPNDTEAAATAKPQEQSDINSIRMCAVALPEADPHSDSVL